MITVTLSELFQNYLTYLQAQNSKINTQASNLYWQIQAGAMASIMLDLYYNLQIVTNSIYPQNAVGDQVDRELYARGLPARGGTTYSTVTVNLSSTPPVIIPINTIFTSTQTGNQYQNLQNFTIVDNTTPFTFYAISPGTGYLESIGNTLASGNMTVSVLASTEGQLEESDQSCIIRILQSIRAPISGARQTDYQVYTLQTNQFLSSPIITDSITIPSFVVIDTVGILGVFALQGTTITEYQLNQGLLPATTFVNYNRYVNSTTQNAVNINIQSQRLVGIAVIVGTCYTQQVVTNLAPFPISVSLVSEYSLSTIINLNSQNQFNEPITIQLTVEQLIQREIRRAICNQPFGATNINGQNTITMDSIIYALNLQLSSVNGAIAQLLTNIMIGISDISVPNYNYSITDLYYVYDITSYNNIAVTQI